MDWMSGLPETTRTILCPLAVMENIIAHLLRERNLATTLLPPRSALTSKGFSLTFFHR
jgi:hypothetical protein